MTRKKMVREIKSIENDCHELENQVRLLREQFEKSYQEYTDILGETLQRQLIFSVYQICTQEYPEKFLELSLSQQQEVQKKIRDLTKEAKENLKLGGEVLEKVQRLNQGRLDELETILSEEWEKVSEEERNEQNSEEISFNSNILKEILSSKQEESTSENTPENLANWANLQEEAIVMALENVSRQSNKILREAGILPREFPKEMIEAALESEGTGSISNRAPGVLYLMLEVERKNEEDKRERDESEFLQLILVRLRVGELEFAAPTLNTQRRALRNLGQKLQQLQEKYYKLKREKSIAQAELAWRSSWYED